MTQTPILDIEQVAAGQNQKEVTINDGILALEMAGNDNLAVSVSSGNATVTSAQYRRAVRLEVTGASTSGRTVTLPAIKRLIALTLDASSTDSISVVVGSSTQTVAPNEGRIFYTDGTTNGLAVLASGTGTGSSYTLPTASSGTLGGVKVTSGSGIAISSGQISLKLDDVGATQGQILYRNGSAWVALSPGTAGQVLQSGGASANPSWATSSSAPVTSVAGRTGVITLTHSDLTDWASSTSSFLTTVAVSTLSDGPGAPASNATKPVRANSGGTALEYYFPPYDISTYIEGVMTNAETVLRLVAARGYSLPSGASGSYGKAGTAATASTTLSLSKNGGAAFGALVWGIGGTSATVTISSTTSFTAGDVLSITGPATADLTLADIAITLAGTRT